MLSASTDGIRVVIVNMNELTDPEILREREELEFIDTPPEEHQRHFELYESIAGMAIVGVTDEGDRLLLQREDAAIPVMPYGWTEPGSDWMVAARKAVADSTDIEIVIDGVNRVRHHTYRSETGQETTGYDVVFTATPKDSRDLLETSGFGCRSEWTVMWRDTATLDLPDDEDNDVLSDIRLFVE